MATLTSEIRVSESEVVNALGDTLFDLMLNEVKAQSGLDPAQISLTDWTLTVKHVLVDDTRYVCFDVFVDYHDDTADEDVPA
jgi:hypothetical protein